ncbi:hypothetical protein [Taklimakanibacter lacteus]|uniref:hypothetical protein n=1 Tax=Taklimakanibacter lacteus TaxID=2268456 RepID=UPI000E670EFF
MTCDLKRLLAAAAGALLLASCGTHVPESEFPGIYVLKEANAQETIKVIAGGTYNHRVERDGVLILDEFGYWDKDYYEGAPGITFKSFQVNLRANRKPKGYWFVVPERSWRGSVLLCVEDNLCFEKKTDGGGGQTVQEQ